MKIIALLFVVLISFLPFTAYGGIFSGKKKTQSSEVRIHDATVQDVETSLSNWDGDAVVMFYAPWCPHCKQLYPVMQEIARQMSSDGVKKVSFARFNCEESYEHMAVCEGINLKAYPTIIFFGQGKLPDSDPVSKVLYGTSGTPHDNTAVFNGGLYFYAIRDWILTLHTVSKFNVRQQALKELLGFGGKKKTSVSASSSESQKELALQEENKRLRDQLALLQEALKTDESPYGSTEKTMESYLTEGDAFEVAYQQGYSDNNLALRTCLADRSLEYCQQPGIWEKEPYCALVEPCLDSNYASDDCKPPTCPFAEEGRRFSSVCLNEVVLADYQELVNTYLNLQANAA